jgi:hypothetical protein
MDANKNQTAPMNISRRISMDSDGEMSRRSSMDSNGASLSGSLPTSLDNAQRWIKNRTTRKMVTGDELSYQAVYSA